MHLDDPIDRCLVVHALVTLAEQTEDDVLSEHAWSLATEYGEELGIDPADAVLKLPYAAEV